MLGYRQRHLPYFLKRIGDSNFWMPFNRGYETLARDSCIQDNKQPTPLEYIKAGGICFRLTESQANKLRELSSVLDGHDYGPDKIQLYNERCAPESQRCWNQYQKIQKFLIGLTTSANSSQQLAIQKLIRRLE
jgi:hypothetical protein